MIDDDEEEIYDPPHAVCPKCGKKKQNMWEFGMDDGDVIEIDCDCGHTYAVRCDVSIDYVSYNIKGEKK